VRAGGRFVRYAPTVRRLLLRVILFVVPGSVVWGLLPVVAHQELRLGASGYGVLLAALGVGAIAGALLMPRIRRVMSANRLILVAGLIYGGALIVVALVPHELPVGVVLVLAGAAWMTLVSRMNATLQLLLPNWVRARGFGIYQVVFAGAQAFGALIWGQVAEWAGLPATFVAAAVLMLAGTATVPWLPVHEHDDADRSPAVYWAEPHIMLEPSADEGPVLVSAVYRVRDESAADFVEAMDAVRLTRLRTGATRWGLFRDGEDPVRYVEVYQVPTWEDHLRQHEGRLTGSDEEVERRAVALAEGPAEVTHLLPADKND
jgi:MFS family permease